MIAMIDPSDFTPPYNHQLCKAIADTGQRIELIGSNPSLYKPQGYSYRSHFYALSQKLRAMPKGVYLSVKGLEHMLNMQTLARQLQRRNPQVIHFQWMPLPSIDRRFLARLRTIAPLVFTVHDTQPFNGDPSSSLQVRGWLEAMSAFDKLIVHTQFSAQQLINLGVPEAKLVVVPIGSMDTMPLSAPPPDTSKAVVLFFGSIKPYKGLDVLLRAIQKLKPQLKAGVQLKIYGRAQMNTAPLRQLSQDLGIEDSVEWNLGFVDERDIPNLFYSSNVVALPYRAIDASGVMTQALIYGRPVVASRIGGLANFVEEEKNGFLVTPDNVEQLAHRLGVILDDPSLQLSMANAAYQRAQAMPTWNEIAEQTLRVYNQLD